MAIVFPLSLPASPALRSVRFGGSSVVAVPESPITLAQQIQSHPGQAWRAEVTLPPVKGRAEGAEWEAFLLSLNGREGSFLMGHPLAATARGVATGTPLVDGASQTGSSLATDGWTPSIAGILKKFDFIQLGSGATARLHAVLTDADSDGAGAATLDIWPRLRESPADGAAVVVANTLGRWRMDSNEPDWDIGLAAFYGFSFSCSEDLA